MTKPIDPARIEKLVRAAEAVSERESEAGGTSRSAPLVLPPIAIAPTRDYLLAPHEHGYWQLDSNWVTASRLGLYLIAALDLASDVQSELEQTPFLPSTTAKKMNEEARETLIHVTDRLSPINILFRALVRHSAGLEVQRLSEQSAWVKRLDLNAVQAEFKDAFEIFRDRIHFDKFLSTISTSRLFPVKHGAITVLQGPREAARLILVSQSRDAVCAFADFYQSLGCIRTSSITRIFAPDEALFRPYFPYVSGVLDHVIIDESTQHTFKQALSFYEEEDFQHCISTIGLIAEDYLQRIYTTLLREPISPGLTLGQSIDRLHRRIEDILPTNKLTVRPLDVAYENLRNLDLKTDPNAAKSIFRELLAILAEDRTYVSRRIDEINKPTTKKSPFPPVVFENVTELLKWRNAAAHNSRIPLGGHEADRALYCLLSLICWWQEQVSSVDWAKPRVELIEHFLATAKSKSK